MLYYTILSKITHRPYILESYSIDILFLSFSHPSIYLHFDCYCFTTYNQIGFSFFMQKKLSVATMIEPIYHIVTGSLYLDNMKR